MVNLSSKYQDQFEKLFKFYAEYSQDILFIRDAEFKTFSFVSKAFENIWRLTCEELCQQPGLWLQSILKTDRKKIEQFISSRNSPSPDQRPLCLSYRIETSDQKIRWIQETIVPIYNNNQVCAYMGLAKDVSEEKYNLVKKGKGSHFFKIFAEKIQQAVFWARDPYCTKQIYVSPSFEKIWGKSCASLYENPMSWIETLVNEDRHTHSAEMRLRHLEEKGQDVKYEDKYRIYNSKGEIIWIKDMSFPIYNDDNKFIGFAGIAEDITKEVLHERELQEAKQRAEVANQAKSDFLAMASHELRTPLNAILGMAQIFKNKNINEELNEYVDIISHAGNNLLLLVNDILDFVKLEAGRLSFIRQPFRFNELVLQIVQSMQYQALDKKINLFIEYPLTIPNAIVGDANRVRQILVNLIGNAIKFTEQGFVKVTVNCFKKYKRKAFFEIIVTDTGIGIRKDKLEFIFEKFNQVNSIYYRKHQGLGLGLSIAKELIERMGGKIEVKSEYGKGSQFRCLLPFQLSDLKVKAPLIEKTENSHLRKKYEMKILLVEDNLINQKIAKIMFEDLGCIVDILNNGQEVLENKTKLSGYHIIFMDIGLPDMSGFDITAQLRSYPIFHHVPIVAMTAHVLDRDREQAFESGMNDVLPKPIRYEEIERVLDYYKMNQKVFIT